MLEGDIFELFFFQFIFKFLLGVEFKKYKLSKLYKNIHFNSNVTIFRLVSNNAYNICIFTLFKHSYEKYLFPN